MSLRQVAAAWGCLQLAGCTAVGAPVGVDEEPSAVVEVVPPDPWRRPSVPAYESCTAVAGERKVDVASLGPVETSSLILDRITYEQRWRWPHQPHAVRRAELSYPVDGYLMYAVRGGATPTQHLMYCAVPTTLPGEIFDAVPCGPDNAVVQADPVEHRPEFVALMDGATRIYTDLEALARCAPGIEAAVHDDSGGEFDFRFVEQLSTSGHRQRWVLVEYGMSEVRRTELFTFEAQP